MYLYIGVLISEVVKYTNVAFVTDESVVFMEVSLSVMYRRVNSKMNAQSMCCLQANTIC